MHAKREDISLSYKCEESHTIKRSTFFFFFLVENIEIHILREEKCIHVMQPKKKKVLICNSIIVS